MIEFRWNLGIFLVDFITSGLKKQNSFNQFLFLLRFLSRSYLMCKHFLHLLYKTYVGRSKSGLAAILSDSFGQLGVKFKETLCLKGLFRCLKGKFKLKQIKTNGR